MTNLNFANRSVCDVDFREYVTRKPFLFLESANATAANISGDSVYAKKKGVNAISFSNPLTGSLSIEAQVYPMKLYSMLSDGIVQSSGMIAKKEKIKASAAGSITLPPEVVPGSVFVYAIGAYGEKEIAGTMAETKFTATETGDIAMGTEYEVAYIVNKTTGIHKVEFNNSKLPKAYYITMSGINKGENELLIPEVITGYKCVPKRNFELTRNSDGDPFTFKMEFDLLEDMDGNFFDISQIIE